jgi:hypothetical protein
LGQEINSVIKPRVSHDRATRACAHKGLLLVYLYWRLWRDDLMSYP